MKDEMIGEQKNWPMVSILAPSRNEADFIEDSIKTILLNDYPAENVELLVLDGMSTDGTRAIVEKIMERDSRVKMLDNPGKIVPSAMNIGIKAAKGEYIIRIDCHTKYSRDYVRRCIEVHRRTRADNVGGYCTTLPGADTRVAKAIAAASSCSFGVGNSRFRLTGPEQEVDTVPFGTFEKRLFDRIGYYDERLVRNQDIEMNSRIRKAGGKVVLSPEIKLSYYNRSTFYGIWQQAFNNGLWNPYTIWLVGGGLSARHFIPMFFVLGLAVLVFGALLWAPVLYLLVLYLLMYSGVAMVFALRPARQKKANPLLVWLCFWVFHLAYGTGSVWAVVTIPFKFPNRKKNVVGQALADRKQ